MTKSQTIQVTNILNSLFGGRTYWRTLSKWDTRFSLDGHIEIRDLPAAEKAVREIIHAKLAEHKVLEYPKDLVCEVKLDHPPDGALLEVAWQNQFRKNSP